MILSVHMQNGIDHCQDQYLAMARAVGMSPEDIAKNRTVACAMDDRTFIEPYKPYSPFTFQCVRGPCSDSDSHVH